MDRSEIIEIRKIFNKYVEGEAAVDNLCGCIINTEHEIKGKLNTKLLSLPSNEIKKYYDIFKKTISNNAITIEFNEKDKENDGIQFLLEKSRLDYLEHENIYGIIFEEISKKVPDGVYAAFILHGFYDIPLKGTDKQKIDGDSEKVYDYIIASICPVKTSKGTLGYLKDDDKICENPLLYEIGKPVYGFLYPAFNERDSDTDAILCHRTKELDITEELFNQSVAPIETETKTSDKDIVEDNLKEEDFEEADSSNKDVPSLDSGSIAITHEKDDSYEDDYKDNEDTYSNDYTSIDNDTSSGNSHKGSDDGNDLYIEHRPHTEVTDCVVTISGDLTQVVKKEIDGALYYVIPAGIVVL